MLRLLIIVVAAAGVDFADSQSCQYTTTPILRSQCPSRLSSLYYCYSSYAPIGGYCLADGYCTSTNYALNNCGYSYDVYYKGPLSTTTPSPTAAPTPGYRKYYYLGEVIFNFQLVHISSVLGCVFAFFHLTNVFSEKYSTSMSVSLLQVQILLSRFSCQSEGFGVM